MKHISHKCRLYPTKEQRSSLSKTFGCVRVVWNELLNWRSQEYSLHGNKINYYAASKKLTELKTNIEKQWLNDTSCVALQQALRNQEVAFRNFFSKRSKYPKFKNKRGKQSFRLVGNAFRITKEGLYIAKQKEPIKIVITRSIPENIKSITISMDSSGRYFASFHGKSEINHLDLINNSIGLDVGLTHFVVDSNGIKTNNPKLLRTGEQKLARLQRKLSRKINGSANKNKARLRVARHHAHIADARKDFLHKLSTKIIRENQTISVESLNIAGLVKNRSLAKSISDASWAELIRQLEYKADWYGRTLVKINRFYPSSQLCSTCGHYGEKKVLSIRLWTCLKCGTEHDRDINAAININTAGLAEIKACGELVQ